MHPNRYTIKVDTIRFKKAQFNSTQQLTCEYNDAAGHEDTENDQLHLA